MDGWVVVVVVVFVVTAVGGKRRVLTSRPQPVQLWPSVERTTAGTAWGAGQRVAALGAQPLAQGGSLLLRAGLAGCGSGNGGHGQEGERVCGCTQELTSRRGAVADRVASPAWKKSRRTAVAMISTNAT